MKRFALSVGLFVACLLASSLAASEAQAQYRPKHYGYRSRADYPRVTSSYYSTPYGSRLTTTTSGAFGSSTISSGTGIYAPPVYGGYPSYNAFNPYSYNAVPSVGFGGYYGGSYGAYGGFGGAGFGGNSYGGFGMW